MTKIYSIKPQDNQFAITQGDTPLTTPEKNALAVPSQELAEALAEEWMQHGKFAAGKMPLTLIAHTAIDRVAPQREMILETLLVYVDTDTLAYRSNSSKALLDRQQELWDPVLAWLKDNIGTSWETTQGVMPIDQSDELHDAITAYFEKLDNMQLAACCVLAPCYSSVALAIAVTAGHLSADEAYAISRLEEEFQAEVWGSDPQAQARAERMRQDALAAGTFLNLLKSA